MSSEEINTGEVFYAFNKDMHTPKVKYHLCLNSNSYLIINSKSRHFDLKISPKDCAIIKKECYIQCDQLFTSPIENFKIIKSEELSSDAIQRLLQKIKLSPTLTGIQIKKIVA